MRRTVALLGMLLLTGCGQETVEGNTYEAAGGGVRIEFKSGGKAAVAIGPLTQDCTYDQKGKVVTLVCAGDKTEFTLASDGSSLDGPQQGMLGRLTKRKA